MQKGILIQPTVSDSRSARFFRLIVFIGYSSLIALSLLPSLASSHIRVILRFFSSTRYFMRTVVFYLFKFVAFREFIGGTYSQDPARSQALLAKEVLAEIPDQFMSFMKKHGIKPNPPRYDELSTNPRTRWLQYLGKNLAVYWNIRGFVTTNARGPFRLLPITYWNCWVSTLSGIVICCHGYDFKSVCYSAAHHPVLDVLSIVFAVPLCCLLPQTTMSTISFVFWSSMNLFLF